MRELGDGLDGVREYMCRLPVHLPRAAHVARRGAARSRRRGMRGWRTCRATSTATACCEYFPTDALDGERRADRLRARDRRRGRLRDSRTSTRARMIEAPRATSSRAGSCATRRCRRADLTMRKLAAIDALSRYGAAEPRDARQPHASSPSLWPTSAVLDWLALLAASTACRDACAPQRRRRGRSCARG